MLLTKDIYGMVPINLRSASEFVLAAVKITVPYLETALSRLLKCTLRKYCFPEAQ